MKKIIKKIVAICCAVVAFASMSACELSLSAYDIAVKNGYQGTEVEWLASLHGKDGKDGQDATSLTAADLYKTAVEKGYEGSYLDFCRDVLNVDVSKMDEMEKVSQNLTSVVSINSGFLTISRDWKGNIKKEAAYSAGSGVIIDLDKETGDALIATNYHVVYAKGSSEANGISPAIWVYGYGSLTGGFSYGNDVFYDSFDEGVQATYVGGAMDYDIAILEIKGSEYIKNSIFTEAEIGDSDEIRKGGKVYVIGNPNDGGISITEGIISVESEHIEMESLDGAREVSFRVIRTDAAINGGNSGGGLFNKDGQLIGIVNAKNVQSQVESMGYALPVTKVKNLCENILYNKRMNGSGSAKVAKLGVMSTISKSKAYYDEEGALRIMEEITLTEVAAGYAAQNILHVGDVIKEIKVGDGEWFVIKKQYQIADHLLLTKLGDTVQIKLVTESGEEKTVSIVFNSSSYFTEYA